MESWLQQKTTHYGVVSFQIEKVSANTRESWANCCQHFSHREASGHQTERDVGHGTQTAKGCRLGEEDVFFRVSSQSDTGSHWMFSGMLEMTLGR